MSTVERTSSNGIASVTSERNVYPTRSRLVRSPRRQRDWGTNSKLIELTLKYEHLEWAFSCTESDYLGHATTQHARHAYYHFQMRVYGHAFIGYNDFHVPFKEMDIIKPFGPRQAS